MNRDLALQFVIQILRTSDALLRESRSLFRPFGLSGAQFNVLNILASEPDGLSQRELSDILVVDRSNITGLVDRMAAAGWVQRAPVPGDRRVHRVTLTPAGRRLWEEVNPVYENAVLAAMKPLATADVRAAMTTLESLERRAHVVGRKKAGTTGTRS